MIVKIGVIIQARMSSRRLPGKVLLPLSGKPILQWVVEAVQRVDDLAGVVVATSTEKSDDAIAMFCEEQGVECFRGSLDDVAERFLGALEFKDWDASVRISADSPLIDWRLIAKAMELFEASGVDLVTNVFPRTFPKGQSVEVVRAEALRRAYPHMNKEDREHVTSYFYTHPEQWRLANFTSDQDQSDINLCVDMAEDLARLEQLLGKEVLV